MFLGFCHVVRIYLSAARDELDLGLVGGTVHDLTSQNNQNAGWKI